jgi:Tetracyclin repressor-like, C-terminal domain
MSRQLQAEVEVNGSAEQVWEVLFTQPEQDDLIRAPLAETICIQGGPGTGKTAVGLHRAAFLLYKYLPDKAALEEAVDGAAEGGRGGNGAAGALVALAAAYRRFALAHPHLYRLMNNGPLPREHLPPGLEDRTAAPLLRAAGSRARARAVWAFAHGMVLLELDHRFPADADLDAAWEAGIAAFRPG